MVFLHTAQSYVVILLYPYALAYIYEEWHLRTTSKVEEKEP